MNGSWRKNAQECYQELRESSGDSVLPCGTIAQ